MSRLSLNTHPLRARLIPVIVAFVMILPGVILFRAWQFWVSTGSFWAWFLFGAFCCFASALIVLNAFRMRVLEWRTRRELRRDFDLQGGSVMFLSLIWPQFSEELSEFHPSVARAPSRLLRAQLAAFSADSKGVRVFHYMGGLGVLAHIEWKSIGEVKVTTVELGRSKLPVIGIEVHRRAGGPVIVPMLVLQTHSVRRRVESSQSRILDWAASIETQRPPALELAKAESPSVEAEK